MKTLLKPFLMTCKSEELLQSEDSVQKVNNVQGGLGLIYGYKSDDIPAKDERKLNFWRSYFRDYGRNLTVVRLAKFERMIRIGIPNDLRGELWELCSGSMYLRFMNQSVYQQLLETHKDEESVAKEDIEKDLHRSLPEYAAYQSQEGIDGLRRVLTAYSWKNPEIGYCQAMNIVTSSLLIYMTEEQAFWALNALVDQLCPGYYSSSMYGVLLDQVVLEELVKTYIPAVHEHLAAKDVHLSVACLPWFLTLFVNSMPLPFAFRILDCFFLEGPKIIFQIALAILKYHEDKLLRISDDSELLVIVKQFFGSLNLPNADTSVEEDNTAKLEYSDFTEVTSANILRLRKENELKIIGGVETFTKRNVIRSLPDSSHFSSAEISTLYDYFFGALYYAKDVNTDRTVSKMDFTAFQKMIENMTTWGRLPYVTGNDGANIHYAEISQTFIHRLFRRFCAEGHQGTTFSDTVTNLGSILRGDVMSKTEYLFSLYDEDKDGVLNNEDMHAMVIEFYWLMLTISPNKDTVWKTICNFVRLSVEQSSEHNKEVMSFVDDILKVETEAASDNTRFLLHLTMIQNVYIGTDVPKVQLSVPLLRMIVLIDDHINAFIQTVLPESFVLEKTMIERQKSLGHEIFETLLDEGKKLANNIITPSLSVEDPNAPNRRPSPFLLPTRSVQPNTSNASSVHDISDLEDYEII
ncbi:rab-GTPase-TBC domain-containing protein [Pilobolus umbonatus]|nr:rab-GTPase-TBC domain-containing protein [Pilobolus umbonatus]